MPDYDTPKVPPATPPTIDPDAKPVEARELAQDDGDSEASGSVVADAPETSLGKEKRAALSKRDKADGAGESDLDTMSPEILLPSD